MGCRNAVRADRVVTLVSSLCETRNFFDEEGVLRETQRRRSKDAPAVLGVVEPLQTSSGGDGQRHAIEARPDDSFATDGGPPAR